MATYPPDVKYEDVFVAAQQQARDNGQGLWAETTTTTAKARTTTTAVAKASGGGGTASGSTIVHITKTGKKYHMAGCRYLSKSDITVTLAVAKARGLGP